MPRLMNNHGNYIVSLGEVCRWLGQQAEALGVEIYPGFAGAEVLYNEDGSVKGVATGDMGIGKDAAQGHTRRAWSCMPSTRSSPKARGSLTKMLFEKFRLREGVDPQKFGIGLKELWEVPKDKHAPGLVVHTQGWPLSESGSQGGSFMYHYGENLASVGFVYISVRKLLCRSTSSSVKTHPEIRAPQGGADRLWRAPSTRAAPVDPR
jgi:electron-transferring-flavoprotein dehydrogenase